ncbi:HNH endonuclease [Salmonella enterica]|nr:HNH endonuclease [Salmonella enterica]
MNWSAIFRYDEDTGNLHWNIPRRGHKPNAVACTKHSRGYLQLGHKGKKYFVHRVIWDLIYPEDKLKPGEEIDHINHDKTDNRRCNLRKVPHKDNARNMPLNPLNTSGVTGVVWRKNEGKWQAQLRRNDTCIYLGSYSTFEEAVAVRKMAEKEFGFHHNHGADKCN